MRDRSNGRWRSAPHYGGTNHIFFVLAVATTMIAQEPGTKAKAFLIHSLPRTGPANIFSTESSEEGSLCQTANILTSFP